MDKNQKYVIASHILSYLAENPDAEDTLEGIVQWWLLQQKINFEEARVREALAHLIRQGFVKEVIGPDRRIVYRINRDKYDRKHGFSEPLES